MAIYDPTDDARLEQDKSRRYIQAWSITVVWDNGEEEQISDIPSGVSQVVDDWLTEVEENRFEESEE